MAAFSRENLARRHVGLIKSIIIAGWRQIVIEQSRPEINRLLPGLDFLGLHWTQVFLTTVFDHGIETTDNFQILHRVFKLLDFFVVDEF